MHPRELGISVAYPVVPETMTQSSTTTALEYPISASKAEPELMLTRAMGFFRVV